MRWAAQPGYRAYMLRLRRAGHGEASGWRASLEEVDSGARRTFASPEELLAWLRQQLRWPQDRAEDDAKGPEPEGLARPTDAGTGVDEGHGERRIQ